jgi:hypothetical protein
MLGSRRELPILAVALVGFALIAAALAVGRPSVPPDNGALLRELAESGAGVGLSGKPESGGSER